jgi:signal transduction histidine kinase/DNA-binding response OmpR family regulator
LGEVTGISVNPVNSLWATSNKGLFYIQNSSFKTIHQDSLKITRYHTKNSNIPTNRLTCVQKVNNALWLGSANASAFKFNMHSLTFSKLKLLEKDVLAFDKYHINDLLLKQDELWLGTLNNGVVKINLTTKEVNAIDVEYSKKNENDYNRVFNLAKDFSGTIWATTVEGINKITSNTTGLQAENFRWTKQRYSDKLPHLVYNLYWSSPNVLWVTTYGDGAIKILFNNPNFSFYEFDQNFNILGFQEAQQNGILLISYFGKSKKIEGSSAKGFTFKDYTTISEKANEFPLLSTYKDALGTIWCGDAKATIFWSTNNGKTYFKHKITPTNQKHWKGVITGFYRDKHGLLWISSTNGLIIYSPTEKTSYLINKETHPNSNIRNRLTCIAEDDKNNIWLGTQEGDLLKLLKKDKNNVQFSSVNTSAGSCDNTKIITIFKGTDGVLWLGTINGLRKFNSITKSLQCYSEKEGLINKKVNAITNDADNNLWIGTDYGISKFNPVQSKFENFPISHYNERAYKDVNGVLYFKNFRGFVMFHPNKLNTKREGPKIALTNLFINGKTVNTKETVNHQVVLKKSLDYTNSIVLNHKNRNFSIEFTGLNSIFQKGNSYKYRLVGLSDTWKETSAQSRIASYTNLSSGNYTLEITATNIEGIQTSMPYKFYITILPAWWATWWAQSTFVVLIIVLLIALHLLRIQSIYKKQETEENKLQMEHALYVAGLKIQKEKEVNKMKTEFFTNISHEIRTPLTLIISPLQDILQSSKLNSETKQLLNPIEKNAKRLLQQVNQLLDFRKIEADSQKLLMRNQNICDLLTSTAKNFDDVASKKNIRYQVIGTESPIFLDFDGKTMETVMVNLLSNAFKFTPEDGKITVTVKTEEKWCKIQVKDTGSGIAKEELSLIFNRFYQAQGKEKYKGTGIGLSLVKKIIEQHKGTIIAKSKHKKGATFTIKLPLTVASKTASIITGTSTESKANAVIKNNKKTILLVEDTPDLLTYIQSIFQDSYSVLTATNGEQGLALALKHIPDLIISDVMMPVMDGMAMSKKIKSLEKTQHIPLMLLTAKSNDSSKIEGLELGVDDYITKPFNSRVLQLKVENLIKNQEQWRLSFQKNIRLEPIEEQIVTKEEKFINALIEIIEENIENKHFNTQFLSEKTHVSTATLYRKIKTYTGLTFTEFTRSVRLKKAAKLLVSENLTISHIAEKVGFSNVNYFRTCFVAQFGVTPSVYKKKKTNDPIK